MYIIQGYQYITFGWVMLWITFIIVMIRLYIRVYCYGNIFSWRSWRLAEVFVLIGWLLALGTNICNSIANGVNANNLDIEMTDAQTIIMLKAYWAWAFFYKPAIYSMKAALLCFYSELINREMHRSLWIAIIVIAVLNGMGCASQILYIAFQCIPFTLNWNPEPWSDFCRGPLPYQIVTLFGHTITDLLVFILPFFIVKFGMRTLSRTQKKGAFVMFGLGFINLAIALVLFITRLIALGPNNVPLKGINESIDLLYTIQIATAIAIPCIPQLRLFYKKVVGHYRAGGSDSQNDTAVDIGPTTRKFSLSYTWSKTWSRKGSTASRSFSRPSVAEGVPGAENNFYKYWKPVAPLPVKVIDHGSDADSDMENMKSDASVQNGSTVRSPFGRRLSAWAWKPRSGSTSKEAEVEAKTEVPIDTV